MNLKVFVVLSCVLLVPATAWARGGHGGGGHHGGGHHGGGHRGGHAHHAAHHGAHGGRVPHHANHVAHHGHPNHNANQHHANNHNNHRNWNHGGWHGNHDGWHRGWHRGYWGGWGGWPGFWLGGATGWLGSNYYYNNPYWNGSANSSTYLNYSQPIVDPSNYQTTAGQTNVSQSTNPDGSTTGSLANSDPTPTADQKQALATLDGARAAFKRNNFAEAQKLSEQAISLMPDDPSLHEFRALTLFAQQKYSEAAAAIYAVLSSGPGWDEATLRGLYSSPAIYNQQLASLQDFVRQNPKAPDALFLLAYQQLVAGKRDIALQELERVVQLSPNDQLSAELVKALKTPAGPATKPPANKQA